MFGQSALTSDTARINKAATSQDFMIASFGEIRSLPRFNAQPECDLVNCRIGNLLCRTDISPAATSMAIGETGVSKYSGRAPFVDPVRLFKSRCGPGASENGQAAQAVFIAFRYLAKNKLK
jgi:hypothetical protein